MKVPPYQLALVSAFLFSAAGLVYADIVPDELIIDAFVDGPSTLHLTAEGVYWTNGVNEKPGKWHGANEATYINGTSWTPKWDRPQAQSGPDKSDMFPLQLNSVDVNFHLISISQERGQKGREKRTPPVAKREGAEFTVLIPDPESGPRWYRFSLRKR